MTGGTAAAAPAPRTSVVVWMGVLSLVAMLAAAATYQFLLRADDPSPLPTAKASPEAADEELGVPGAAGAPALETSELYAPKDPFDPSVQQGSGGGEGAVSLVDARGAQGVATVTVGGTSYTIGEQEAFAESFMLLSVAEGCAQLLFGDEQFGLCEGEEVVR